jgi:hypothetical protein
MVETFDRLALSNDLTHGFAEVVLLDRRALMMCMAMPLR